jgi:hypothetical protein
MKQSLPSVARYYRKSILAAVTLVSSLGMSGQGFQIGDTLTGRIERFTEAGVERLSEAQKIGSLDYNGWNSYGAVELNILIRKNLDRTQGLSDKDVLFSGKIGDASYSGYIDEFELDDAIRAVKFISDSLLTVKPVHQIHYTKQFKLSNFEISAYFDPYPTSIFADKEYSVFIDLNRYGYKAFVHLKTPDVVNLLKVLEVAKQKLKDF